MTKLFFYRGEKLPGVPSVFLVVAYVKKKSKKKRRHKGGKKGGKRGERERNREQREQEGQRAREYKEVWRGRAGTKRKYWSYSFERNQRGENQSGVHGGKLMRIKIQFRRRANPFPNVASSWPGKTGSSCSKRGRPRAMGRETRRENLHGAEKETFYTANINI